MSQSISHVRTRALAFSVLLIAALPLACRAQGLGEPPTPSECSQWETDLAARGQSALDALALGWLPACPRGPQVLADALSATSAETDVAFLFALVSTSVQVRHPTPFDAALGVAEDETATEPSRAAGLLALVGQLGGALEFHGVTGPSLLTDPLPSAAICGPALGDPSMMGDEDVPPGFEQRAADTFDELEKNGTVLLANLARCSRVVLGPDVGEGGP